MAASVLKEDLTESKAPGGSPKGDPAPDAPDLRSVLVTSVLNLEKLDVDLYRGTHHWVPVTRRLFGGQILGQALVAAAKSVDEDLYAHSLHCYFVRAGDPDVPVLYQVDRTRNGRSFCVRSVRAIQHGQSILICQASFQKTQPSPLEHQYTMPTVPPPEELMTTEELFEKYLEGISDPNLVEKYRRGLNKILAREVPIEIKHVNPPDIFRRQPQDPKQLFWVRARGYIGLCDMKLHCCVAAYISDYSFLPTALLPHYKYRAGYVASLDHSMWFHAPFRSDDWMLYECESPWAGGSRGLVQGRLWRRDGVLAVTCAQEGLLRVKEFYHVAPFLVGPGGTGYFLFTRYFKKHMHIKRAEKNLRNFINGRGGGNTDEDLAFLAHASLYRTILSKDGGFLLSPDDTNTVALLGAENVDSRHPPQVD